MPLGPSVLTLKNLNIGTTNLKKANSMVNVISVFGRSRFYQSQETKILVHNQISEPAKIKIKQWMPFFKYKTVQCFQKDQFF